MFRSFVRKLTVSGCPANGLKVLLSPADGLGTPTPVVFWVMLALAFSMLVLVGFHT